MKSRTSLVVCLLIVPFCGKTLACSCSLLSAHDHYRQADVAFVGTAVSKMFGGGIRFRVEESFWGTTSDSIVVKHHDPIVCDSFAFKLGQKYLVVGYKEGDRLTAGACNQGAGLRLATGDIHVLRKQRDGKPLPQVYGTLVRRDGAPFPNARVTIHPEENTSVLVRETRTEADGYFDFAKLPAGSYQVVANPEGGGEPIKTYFSVRPMGNRLIMHSW